MSWGQFCSSATNDIPKAFDSLEDLKLSMHADDSNLKFSASSQEELELEAYKKWTKIKQFLDKNNLFLKVGRLNL